MPPREVTLTFRGRDMMSPVLRTIGQGFNSLNDTATATLNGLKALDAGFNNLSQAMNQTFMGVSAQAVIDFGIEMTNLGRTVIRTSNTFEQLAGAIDDPTKIMEQLRAASFGAADDLTLMTGASRLMMMGLATTGDQLARITTLAIALKRPTQDAAGAFDDFGALLANNSIPRLDNFGISSGAVRLRIKELMSGMDGLDRSTAFMQATLEEGEKTLARLGNTVEENVTSLDRLETAFTNVTNAFAEDLATGVIGTLDIALFALGLTPEQQQHAIDEAGHLAAMVGKAFSEGVIPESFGRENFVTEFLRIAGEAGAGQAGFDVTAALPNILEQMPVHLRLSNEATLEWRGTLIGVLDSYEQINLSAQQQIADTKQHIRWQEEEAMQQAEFLRVEEEIAQAERNRQEALNKANREAMAGGLLDRMIELGQFNFGDVSVPPFMTEESAAVTKRLASELKAMADQMAALDEIDDDLFSDEQLETAKRMADNTGKMAANAEKAVEALNNIKLDEVFGQGRGEGAAGLVGDMTADILAAGKAAGATADELERMKRALDLASGAETVGSLGVAGPVAERIAAISLQDADLGAMAALNVAEAIRLAVELDIDPNTEGFINFLMTQATGVSGGGGGPGMTIKVEAGDTLSGIAAETGLTVDELMTQLGLTDARNLQTGTFEIGGGGGGFQEVMGFDITEATAAFGESGTIPTGLNDVLDTSTEVAIAWIDMQTAGEAFAAATQLADMSSAAILGSLSETFPLVKEINENMQPLAGSIENAVGHALNLANEFLPSRDHVLKIFNTLGLMNGKTTKHDILLNVKLTGSGQGGLALTPAKGIEETTAPGTP